MTAQAHRVLLAHALLLELGGDICAALLRLRQLRLQPLLVVAELQERPARKVSGRVHHEESEWDSAPQRREKRQCPARTHSDITQQGQDIRVRRTLTAASLGKLQKKLEMPILS